MKSKIYIAEQSKRLESYRDIIMISTKKVLVEIKKVMDIPTIDIIIADDPMFAIPETGVGGMARNAHLLHISIDPDHKNLLDSIKTEIRSTVAHEIHHCTRMGTVGYGKTLLDALITEGLADHFDTEINNTKPKPWSVALSEKDQVKWLQKAKKIWNRTEYDHNLWFYGQGGEVPRWAGYSLGFNLVKLHLERTKKKPSDLVSTPTKNFSTIQT